MPSVAGADVAIVVVDCVDGRLLRGRRTTVDSGVVCNRVGLLVRMGFLILGYQPALPGVRAVIEEEPVHVLIPRVLVPADVLGLLISCSSAVEPNQCAAADAGQPQPGRHAFGLQATYRRARSCVLAARVGASRSG